MCGLFGRLPPTIGGFDTTGSGRLESIPTTLYAGSRWLISSGGGFNISGGGGGNGKPSMSKSMPPDFRLSVNLSSLIGGRFLSVPCDGRRFSVPDAAF